MATATKTIEPLTRDNGDPIWVGEGGVRQQGSKKLHVCIECHAEVVWLKSKAGKWYTAFVYRGHVDQRFYTGHAVHSREACEQKQAGNAAQRAHLDKAHADRVKSDALMAALNEWGPRVSAFLALGFPASEIGRLCPEPDLQGQ